MSILLVAACSTASTKDPDPTTMSTSMTPTSTLVPSNDSTTSVVAATEPPDDAFDGFTFADVGFFDVPEMSVADERGSGCGASGEAGLPDVLPDGLWFGSFGPKYEYYEPVNENEIGYGYARFGPSSLELDVWCVYSGATAEQKYLAEQCQAETECEGNNTVQWMVEDNLDRMHPMPVAENFVYRVDYYEADAGWSCGLTDPFGTDGLEPAWRLHPVWIAVNDGMVTEVFGHCGYYFEARRLR